MSYRAFSLAMNKLLWILLFSFSWNLMAEIISARREPSEDYTKSALKYFQTKSTEQSAYGERKHFNELDFSVVPELGTEEDLLRQFAYVRDLRFFDDPQKPDFKRRLTWLYPDDGCYMRAHFTSEFLQKNFDQSSVRIYLFGNLRVETANSSYGKVTWWFHTAAILKVGEKIFVMDPAIEPLKPLELEAWVEKQGVELKDAMLSICDMQSYAANSSCHGSVVDVDLATAHSQMFLYNERSRQKELHRDPDQVLGDHPPWAPGAF